MQVTLIQELDRHLKSLRSLIDEKRTIIYKREL